MAKVKKWSFTAPTSIEEASALLAKFGALRNDLLMITAHAEATMRAAVNAAAAEATPISAEAKAIQKLLIKWADKYRANDLSGDGKTIQLPAGEIYWRLGGEALALMEGFTDEALIAELRRRRLTDFIRTSEALDKVAIKDEWERVSQIPGFQRVQTEFVYLKPLTIADAVEVKTKKVEIVATSGEKETADA